MQHSLLLLISLFLFFFLQKKYMESQCVFLVKSKQTNKQKQTEQVHQQVVSLSPKQMPLSLSEQ